MTLDYDPIPSLQSIGYLEREASFLYLVAVHSGYFLRRQYARFAGRDGGTLFARFLKKANRRRHIHVIECGYGWHIYHLTSKTVYEALGRRDSQNRRMKGDGQIKSRLMTLDFILANLDTSLLEDEASKVEFFLTQCGVRREVLPCSNVGRPMYFPDCFPVFVSNSGVPRFTFFDEGQATVTRFERYLGQYRTLFEALGQFELIFVADRESNSARAKAAFNRFLPADRLRGITSMTPLGVEHFLEYLDASQRYDMKGGITSARDLEVLREGERLYTTLEHRALQAAWNNGSTNAGRIRQRFSSSALCAAFSTVVLPYRYPLEVLRQLPLSEEACKTLCETPDETPSVGDKS